MRILKDFQQFVLVCARACGIIGAMKVVKWAVRRMNEPVIYWAIPAQLIHDTNSTLPLFDGSVDNMPEPLVTFVIRVD